MWVRFCAIVLATALVSGQRDFTRRKNPGRNAESASRFSPSAPDRGAAQFGSVTRGSPEADTVTQQSQSFGAAPAPSRRAPAPARQASAPNRSAPRRGSSGSSSSSGGGRRVFAARTTSAPDTPAFDTECPSRDGFFADAFQCDRYYECRDFIIKEKICPDGLVFNDYSTAYGRCDQPFSVNCTGREELQPAKPAGDCQRQNGYFPDPVPSQCGSFIFCVDGKANRISCPAGLVFSLETGTCQWPDQAGRTGCSSEEVLEFKCPGADKGKVVNPGPGQLQNPRFADPNDCQFFFSCLDGVIPRRHGCPESRVFNDITKQCDDVKNVPECAYEK